MKKTDIHWNLEDDISVHPLIRKILFEVKKKNRKLFCYWINNISKKHLKNFDWWLTIPSSRNPYLSNLYDYICILETLDILIRKKIKLIITTSCKGLHQIIKKKEILNNSLLKIKLIKKNSKFEFLYIPKAIIFYSIIFFFIKIFIKKNNLLYGTKNILVESFFLTNSNNKESFNKNIFKINYKKIFLVPNFLIQKNVFLILKKIRRLNTSKYIFKEHHLKLSDLIYSLFHFIRKKNFLSKYEKFKNWDLSPLVNEEIRSNKNYYSAIIGILNLRFFKRIKEKNISLKKTISLFENQAAGRGWSLGSRTFYPDVENLGYQGYINFSQFLNSMPCKFEEEAKILPNKIAVINKIFKKNKREFFPKIKVIPAPALNYQFKDKKITKKFSNEFLLVLTGIKKVDQKLIDWSFKFLDTNKNVRLKIRFHPILPSKSLNIPLINNSNNQIILSNEDISLLLKRAFLVVSTGPTTAIYEALLNDCYLIVPVFDPCDKTNLENCKIPKDNYDLVFDFQEFSYNLQNMINNKKDIKLKNVKKNFYFEKINKKNMRIFL